LLHVGALERQALTFISDMLCLWLCLHEQVLEKRISLFDYELIKDSNVRAVYFGQFAGYAGMIDGLRGLGECKNIKKP
jgi:hypothetical protein